jgi:TatD DNase family protein
LNDSAFAGHEADYVARAAERGVTHMAIVGSDAELNQGALDLARRFAHLYAVVGWHPESARLYTPAAEKVLRSQLAQPKTVAIGEIGLDYHWDSSPRPVQRQVFARQLALAAELHQPVVIHTREAMQDTYDILAPQCRDRIWRHHAQLQRRSRVGGEVSGAGHVRFFQRCGDV